MGGDERGGGGVRGAGGGGWGGMRLTIIYLTLYCDCSLDSVPSAAAERAIARYTCCCAMARGHCLNIFHFCLFVCSGGGSRPPRSSGVGAPGRAFSLLPPSPSLPLP